MRNWLVVANSARARVLEEPEGGGSYTHLADLVHPQSRQKGIDLADDRPGHVEGTGHGLGGVEYQPRTGAREREHKRLAREVAAVVNSGVAAGHCAGLVLVASDPFLGHLKAELSEQARKRVLHTLPKDYTALNDVELARRLHELSA